MEPSPASAQKIGQLQPGSACNRNLINTSAVNTFCRCTSHFGLNNNQSKEVSFFTDCEKLIIILMGLSMVNY